jgi:ferritin-like metal-binding protein YciE
VHSEPVHRTIKEKRMSMKTMKDLLIEQLHELYAAEQHSLKVLPELSRVAQAKELSQAFGTQIGQTEQHITRLKDIFKELGVEPRSNETEGMKGELNDCVRLATMSNAEPHVRDAALIGAMQHVKHDEIAGYGCAKAWASVIGSPHIASELEATLHEEHETDAALTKLAATINQEALAPAGT